MAAPSFGLSSGGLAFGANPPTTQQQAGFNFTSPATGTAAPTFGFGTPATTTTASGLSFGMPSLQPAAPAPSFGLGSTPQATQQPSLFGHTSGGSFSFGTPVAAATTTSAQPSLNFGLQPTLTAATTSQPGFSFGTSTSTPATTAPSSLAFNMPATSTISLNFNTAVTQTPGFFSTTTSAPSLFTSSKPAFGLTPTTTASLFGPKLATTSSSGGNLGGEVTPPSLIKAVKDNPVPPEMMQLIDNFKLVIKQQKNYSSEVARSSIKPLQKTSEDIESIKHLLAKLERAVNLNKSMNNKLKSDTMRCVTDCEMAQRTMEISPGFQTDNTAPLDYFSQLAERFQEQVILLRIEIENTEKHIHSALDPTALSPQELNDSMKRLHECFVALAGRLQLVHSSMSTLKQSHLEMRRKKTSDFTDIFDRKQAALKQKCDQASPGPHLTANSLYSSVAALVQSRIAPDQHSPLVGPTGLPSYSLLQQPNAFSTPTTTDNVQLKSPPGSKRGKR